jgi:hypothetical protein
MKVSVHFDAGFRQDGGFMAGERNIAGVTAIGSLTAVVVLLTSLPVVKADELTDLRNNQLLLQQRLDQVPKAQAPAVPPDAPGTTPLLDQPRAGGSFPRSFLIPGTETSVRVGGSVDQNFDYRTAR